MLLPKAPARLLEAAIVTVGTLALLAWIEDGLRLSLGGLTFSARGPLRPALVLLGLALLRTALARRDPAAFTTHPATCLPLVILTMTAVGSGLLHLTTVSGGADSYGYVSAASLLREGTLIRHQPEAAWLPAANATAVLSPLGYVPGPGSGTIVPLYPLGFPALIAATSLVLPVGAAPYLVAPAMAVLMLVVVYRIALDWIGAIPGAWLAVCLAAWDPLVFTYAKQPMSDIPAAAWLLLSIWCLVRPSPMPLLAGIAAGASFLTRPGGLGAIAAVALLAATGVRPSLPAIVRFGTGLAPAVALQAWLQWRLFGSPWRTGYGDLGELYSGATLLENAGIYARALVGTHTTLWVPLVVVGLIALRRRGTALWILLMLAASLIPYLLYFRFDHWETLRFVLPTVVLLDITAAAGATLVLSRAANPVMHAVVLVAFAALAAIQARTFLNAEGVPRLMDQERRYVVTAEWIDQQTPSGSLVFAGQHSGSLRHYARRVTLRWDVIAPGDLAPVVREAHRRGLAVYAALDGMEQPPFRDRFAAALQPAGSAGPETVTMLPAAQLGNVQVWELVSKEDAR